MCSKYELKKICSIIEIINRIYLKKFPLALSHPRVASLDLDHRSLEMDLALKGFHSKCDEKSSTLTIIKAKSSGFICCGFTEAEYESCEEDKSDPNAFIFSLINKKQKTLKNESIRSK